jgi:hypothetical protein
MDSIIVLRGYLVSMIIKLTGVLCILILLSTGVAQCFGEDSSVQPQSDGAYWKAKYNAQKARSLGQYRRIQLLNKRIRAFRGSVSPLQAAIVPWVNLAECESGNDWRINSGNGFFGGVQFNGGTWRSYGGRLFGRTANLASPLQQVAIAERTLARQGRGAWPHCTKIGAW